MGSAAVTSRGFKEAQMEQIGAWIDTVIQNSEDTAVQTKVAAEIKELCKSFPAPGLEHLV